MVKERCDSPGRMCRSERGTCSLLSGHRSGCLSQAIAPFWAPLELHLPIGATSHGGTAMAIMVLNIPLLDWFSSIKKKKRILVASPTLLIKCPKTFCWDLSVVSRIGLNFNHEGPTNLWSAVHVWGVCSSPFFCGCSLKVKAGNKQFSMNQW